MRYAKIGRLERSLSFVIGYQLHIKQENKRGMMLTHFCVQIEGIRFLAALPDNRKIYPIQGLWAIFKSGITDHKIIC
jgi:hypothetical protein